MKTKVILRKLIDFKVEVVRIRKDSEPQNTQEEDEQKEENPNNKTVIHKVGFQEEAEMKIMPSSNEKLYDSSWGNPEASERMSNRTPIFSGKFNEKIDDWLLIVKHNFAKARIAESTKLGEIIDYVRGTPPLAF